MGGADIKPPSEVEETCFHCGLPVPDFDDPINLDVLDVERHFCCHGCEAVCSAIVGAGLEDYYKHRTTHSATADIDIVPDFLKQSDLYDRPEIQKNFVLEEGAWREASLLLENIRCPACLWLNERHLRSLDGVMDVHIDDVTQRARVKWDPQKIRLSEILTAITSIGYIAHPYDATRSKQLQKVRNRRSTERLIFAGVIGMLVMQFSFATYLLPAEPGASLPMWVVLGRWTGLFLTACILIYSGQEFFAGVWSDIKNRRLGMDVPVVLGLLFAWFGSLNATITSQGEVYLDSIAMFVFFLLLARRLELKGKLKAAGRLEELARVTPRTASRIDSSGERHRVAVEDLQVGDLVHLLPGETVQVDGEVVRGESGFDESLLTGESLPVLHEVGDALLAGSVNGEQSIDMRVTHTVQASAVSEIRKLIDRGLAQRPGYAELADRIATWFVAVILVLAATTATYWFMHQPDQWLATTVAVLIVTCPCALALATPMSLSVSAGKFVGLGMLPLRMKALDALAKSKLFVFDKTGTLTHGKPELAEIVTYAGVERDDAMGRASLLSADSEHPVAKALRAFPHDKADTGELFNLPGAGTRARINGEEWFLGKAEYIEESTPLTAEQRERVESFRQQGYLVSVLASGSGVVAIFTFHDPLRSGVEELLSGLKETGVEEFVILSGDSQQNVERVANKLGITSFHANLSPREKFDWVQSRQKEGRQIAMFGDGINDAPTLALADVSLSFADATDLANNSSDFLLLNDEPEVLVKARRLAKRTHTNLMQNFAWAAGYNFIAVPFAAVGLIPPWGAAIGMSLSSLVVVVNALRLQRVDD
ncbi:copper-translocating P-type ATPase [Solemya velum gill symbiont]|uniref:Copper-translocating P-type ATPase n=1 Tax=Solemya velum gill symbiont TaxID=2340 RepID=A0A1T2DII5_SOVGS|nr:heavy metal translocating P-type ATPase [Solemya velum gill symbiont]OOY34839.1 copper-translocating P-type ATPase [Solemya velum gill symbiont]OOY37554.1 copper-translocating P-type ATPase [Solemya velum gill symbiont]OOY40176.1 copper-translocating P-type ATPase [Solemya velum gill symbiont]OOY43473.1 copper-translocating P-type ATPase [Solemya velum gill symbiont]OOY46889.1 copper-translocating P-type ATPase [Solemya velum gill symbiont]